MTGFVSPSHILLLLVVVLLLFGARRLPEFGRSLGTGMREFKHSLDHGLDEGPRQITGAAVAEPDAKPDDAHQPIPKPDP
jgi:sec-independent protein translocase protein TatA